jgi:hypothetical protein
MALKFGLPDFARQSPDTVLREVFYLWGPRSSTGQPDGDSLAPKTRRVAMMVRCTGLSMR